MAEKYLTTGDIAKYCGVNFRTVIRWADKGILKSHKLPGRGDNRISKADFLEFLNKNDMPIPVGLQESRKKRVLIIDDDPQISSAMVKLLQDFDLDIQSVAGGFQAGIILGSLRPDLVVLDLMMPGMGGFEVLQFMKNSNDLKSIKILVVSGAEEIHLKKAKLSGADETLQKPFNPDHFRKFVNQLLR